MHSISIKTSLSTDATTHTTTIYSTFTAPTFTTDETKRLSHHFHAIKMMMTPTTTTTTAIMIMMQSTPSQHIKVTPSWQHAVSQNQKMTTNTPFYDPYVSQENIVVMDWHHD